MSTVDESVADRAPAAGTDGAAAGYRPGATLRVGTEIRRQLTRRRTRFVLGFLVLLPVILFLAFKYGTDNPRQRTSYVELATTGAANFTVFALYVSSSFLLIVIVALFCGDTVASEANWGSLRYLLAAPVRRSRLLGVKLVVGLLYSALSLVLLTGAALAVGAAAFGWHPFQTLTGDSIGAGPAVLRILGVIGYLAISLLFTAGLAFLLSTWTDSPLGAVGGAVLLFIVSSILDQVTALGSLRDVLPTHYQWAFLDLLTTPVQTDDMARGAISALAYATAFTAAGWWHFLHKDITS